MAENRAEFVIALDGDDSAIRGIFSAFKKTVKDGAAELEQTTSNIVLFRGLKENLDKARVAVTDATAALAKLRDQVKATQDAGGEVGKDLAKNVRDAERAVASANKEFAKQEAAVGRMAKSLKAAGVDLGNLATEEIRLSAAAKQAAAAEADRQAAAVLGIKLSKDVAAGIQQQVAALNTLKASGAVSSLDLANAQKALARNVKEATANLEAGGKAASGFGQSISAGLLGALGPLASITAAVGLVVSAFKGAIEVTREFNQGVAEIGTVTKLSRDELAGLGEGARQIAASLGVDLQQALRGVFDLIRSGVPAENSLEVLRISAEAAKASLTDIGTGVKAANLLIDAFGASVGDLPLLFDKIIRGAREGGATFKEFADSAGPLLNVARAAGVSFDDLLAVLTVLVDKSGNAEKSFADLTKILVKLDTTDVKRKLADLGITGDSLADTFRQIGERGLSLQDVLGLELAAGGAKSAAALATLASNAGEVPDKLNAIRDAAGETKRALDGLLDTPKERSERFNAALRETGLLFGEMFGDGSKLQQFATDVLEAFNDFNFGVDKVTKATPALRADLVAIGQAFGAIPVPAEAVAAGFAATGAAADEAAKQMAAADVQANKIKQSLAALNVSLLANVKALQDATARDLADATARADAEIAQLSRRRDAEAATAEATVAIRLKLAKDQLAIIQDTEKAITAAVNAATAARERAARASGESQKKIDADTAAARLAGIGQTLAAYQKLYADLTALAQTAAARIQSFDEARVSIAQKVEDEIRAIRFSALDGLDQYVARNAEVDRLVSEGRRKAAEGDTAAAKQFFEQAINESKGLAEVVDRNGVKVISATQAQADRIAALKKIQDASNESFEAQAEAAKKGSDATVEEMGRVAAKVLDLQAQYDALKATVADGLQFRIETDEASVAKAFATLDELTRPRTVTVTVKTVNEAGAPVEAPAGAGASGFRLGGLVRRPAPAVRGFARGGPVFRTPGWLKVPGQGRGDTVPAALQAGSFVVRRAASRYYGDGLMGRLARGLGVRGYAAGGTVTQDEIRRYALSAFGFDPFLAAPPSGGPGDRQAKGPIGGAPRPRQPGDPLGRDQSVQPTDPPLSFDTRPIPDELITAANVIEYAREMLNMVGQTNPLLGALLPAILDGIRNVQARPDDRAALEDLLKAAETIGANPYVFAMWGKTTGSIGRLVPTWFVDWLAQRGILSPGGDIASQSSSAVDVTSSGKRLFDAGFRQAGPPPRAERILGGIASDRVRKFFGFAAGGAPGGDTVPAMLTPGEWVIRRPAVRRYGSDLLHAINSMAIPRAMLANMITPPPRPAHFAGGGPVAAGGGGLDRTPGARSASGITVNVNAAAGDLFSETNVRRFILPVLRDVIRKSA